MNRTRCAEVLSLSPASTAEPEDPAGVRTGRPPPQVKVLLIAERVEGFFLARFTDRGELVGETQHDTLDEAMWQANSEYRASPGGDSVPTTRIPWSTSALSADSMDPSLVRQIDGDCYSNPASSTAGSDCRLCPRRSWCPHKAGPGTDWGVTDATRG
jgi:hypothetical protein